MLKGTIVLIPFPFTDLTGQKVRPALVLYNQKEGDDCIVIFISSSSQNKIGVYDIPLVPSIQNGIKIKSTIKVSKMATLQKKMILGELGVLESSTLKDVDRKLKNLFNL